MSPRTRQALLAAAVFVVPVAFGAAWWLRQRQLPEDPLDNVPKDASAALFIDVRNTLASPLVREILAGTELPVARGAWRQRCGFDPIDQIDDAILFVGGEQPDRLEHFAALARGRFDHEKLVQCLRSSLDGEGVAYERTEVEGMPAIRAGDEGHVAAFVGRKGIAWGSEGSIRDLVQAGRGDVPRFGEDPEARALFEAVRVGRQIAFVAKLPAHWREALERHLRADDVGLLAPFASTTTIAAGARVRRGLGLSAIFVLGSAADATIAADTIEDRVQRIASIPLVALSPVGPMLRRIQIDHQEARVVVAIDLTDEQVQRLLALRRQLAAPDAPPLPPDLDPDRLFRPTPAPP